MRSPHDAPSPQHVPNPLPKSKGNIMQSSIASARRRFAGTLISVALASFATVSAAEPGYLTTAGGDHVKTITGLCVHTSDWKPGMTNAECDPVAPVAVAAEPAPARSEEHTSELQS